MTAASDNLVPLAPVTHPSMGMRRKFSTRRSLRRFHLFGDDREITRQQSRQQRAAAIGQPDMLRSRVKFIFGNDEQPFRLQRAQGSRDDRACHIEAGRNLADRQRIAFGFPVDDDEEQEAELRQPMLREIAFQPAYQHYDLGFTAGGGNRTDLFDAARRAIVAGMRRDNLPPAPTVTLPGRPLPGNWPKPGDAPRPARWSRRLAILSTGDIGGDPAWDFLGLLRARPGAGAATVIVLTPAGFVCANNTVRSDVAEQMSADRDEAARQLGQLLASCEFDDILVTLQGHDLDVLDAIAHVLPLARTMERTRNSRLQQRSHLRTWLDRGFADGETRAQGHIRWGKTIAAFYGSLGEFTVRHVGPAPGRGHLIRVETREGLATGYAAVDGTPLTPEIIVSNKAKLRPAMATALRAFAAATPIMAAARAA